MKTIVVKIMLLSVIFYVGWDGLIFSNNNQNLTSRKIEENDTKEILQLMKKFAVEDSSEKEQRIAQGELARVFGLKALPYLLEGLKDKNEQIRYFSIETIGFIIDQQIRKEGKRPGRVDIINLHLSEQEKEDIEQCFQAILKLWKDPNPKIREATALFLGIVGKQEIVPTLENLLNDPELKVRNASLFSLWLLTGKKLSRIKVLTGKEPQTPEEYAEYLKKRDEWGLWISAGQEIKKFGEKAIPVLINLAKSDKEPGRCRAITILGEMKSEEAIPVFESYLKEDTKDETMYSVQLACIGALFEIDTKNSIRLIEEYGLAHKNPEIRYFKAEQIYRKINSVNKEDEKRYLLLKKDKERMKERAKGVLINLTKEVDNDKKFEIGVILVENKEKEGIPILIGLMKGKGYLRKAKDWLEEATGQKFGDIPPVVSKKMVEEYIKKWEDWWEKNKDTFKFPEEKN